MSGLKFKIKTLNSITVYGNQCMYFHIYIIYMGEITRFFFNNYEIIFSL